MGIKKYNEINKFNLKLERYQLSHPACVLFAEICPKFVCLENLVEPAWHLKQIYSSSHWMFKEDKSKKYFFFSFDLIGSFNKTLIILFGKIVQCLLACSFKVPTFKVEGEGWLWGDPAWLIWGRPWSRAWGRGNFGAFVFFNFGTFVLALGSRPK